MTHQHCPNCGDEVESVDYAVRWPWLDSCRCMIANPEVFSYTGCECHDSMNEAWVRDHHGVEVAIPPIPSTVLDYRQLADGSWKLKEEHSGDEARR